MSSPAIARRSADGRPSFRGRPQAWHDEQPRMLVSLRMRRGTPSAASVTCAVSAVGARGPHAVAGEEPSQPQPPQQPEECARGSSQRRQVWARGMRQSARGSAAIEDFLLRTFYCAACMQTTAKMHACERV